MNIKFIFAIKLKWVASSRFYDFSGVITGYRDTGMICHYPVAFDMVFFN